MNVRLYILQRATAAIMAPLVLGHLVVIFYATSRGLSAAEILGRTRGSVGWGAVLRAVRAGGRHARRHRRAGGGVRMAGLRGRTASLLMWGFGLVLAGLGLRAVAAVVL